MKTAISFHSRNLQNGDRVALGGGGPAGLFFTVHLLLEATRSIQAWRVKEHDVRPVTLRHDMHAFSKFFKFAIRNHWCRENPMKLVKIPSDADAVRIHVISPKEEKKYFRWAIRYPDLPDVGRLMLNQGMRPEEVVALRKDDIDLFRGQLHVRKGKTKSARRTLDLISESHKILAHRMLKAGEWLFPSRRLPGQHVKRLNTTHDKVCGKVGLNFVLYDFAIASQRGWRKRGSTWRPWRQSLDIPQFGSLSAMSTLRQSTDAKR